MIALHPLTDVAAHMPADLASPERWLTKQIRAGRIRARKIGRRWYMTDADLADALEVFANIPARPEPTHPAVSAAPLPVASVQPSAASMRRRLKVAQ